MSGGNRTLAPVSVEIGVLSLPRVARSRAQAIARGVQRELERLLSSDALQRELRARSDTGTMATLDAGRVSFTAQERAEPIGARIAAQITRNLAQNPRGRR